MKLVILSFVIGMTFSATVRGEWQPPERPSPTAILREAEADARAGRHADALAKHLWYHGNALKYDSGQTGVRLSFALSDWYDLGADYPPALAEFEKVRATARKGVLDSTHPKHVRQFFIDFAAMSERLRREDEVVDLFLELRKKSSDDAALVYRRAQGALVKAKQFDVCGEFLDSEKELQLEIEALKLNRKLAKERKGANRAHLQQFGERHFRHSAATIVLILAKNGKVDEAKAVAQQAREAWNDKSLNEELDRALEGKTPNAFP